MTEPVKWSILIALAYLLGSIPFALLIGKSRGIDIRQHGSGNVGASNVGRVLGRRFGMLCFTLDVLKGFVPTVLAGWWCGLFAPDMRDHEQAITQTQMLLWLAVSFAAILGHTNSIFLRFKGGKGVATAFGSMVGIYPHLTWPILAAMAVWLAAVKLWRIISLASMAAAISVPLWHLISVVPGDGGEETFIHRVFDRWPFVVVTMLLALLVVWKHRSNIARLRAGAEARIGEPPHPPNP